MTKPSKIILILCLLGTAYYSFKIVTMKETLDQLQLSVQVAPASQAQLTAAAAKTSTAPQADQRMQLLFSLSTTDVDLMERCKAMFTQSKAQDQVNLVVNGHVAQLNIQRLFPASLLNETLHLHQRLQENGCLQNQTSFVYKALPH